MLRTRPVAPLAGCIQVFVIPVGDNGLVVLEVLCFYLNPGGVAPGAVSREGVIRRGPFFGGFLPEHRSAELAFSQYLRAHGGAVLHDEDRHIIDIILFLPLTGHVVLFHPFHEIRHVLDFAHVALFPLAEIGDAVGNLVIWVRVSLAPVALAADRGGNRNPDGAGGFIRAVQIGLGQSDALFLFGVELEEVFTLGFVAFRAQCQMDQALAV